MLKTAEFWVMVSFFAFLGLLLKMGVPKMITSALDDRAESIRKELDDARRLRQEAQDLLAEYKKKQGQAEDEAKAIIEQAQREVEAMKIELARTLKEQIERRGKLAEDKISRAEAQAISEVRSTAVELATAAAEQVLKERSTGDVSKGLVDQSIRTCVASSTEQWPFDRRRCRIANYRGWRGRALR